MNPSASLISRVRNTIARAIASPPAMRGTPQAGYMRDNRGAVMSGWRPALREISDDVRLAWTDAAARTVDLTQNVGWVSGAIDQAISNTVGLGLRLNAQPDPSALGLSETEASEWAKTVEKAFNAWCRRPLECDVEGRRNFGQMQAAAFRGWMTFGEIVGEIPYRERPGSTYGTKVRLIPPYRLSQKTLPSERLVQGVRMDVDNLPISYVFSQRDPVMGTVETERRARDDFGRPRIVHVFDGMMSQVRGISPLVPVLAVARQYDQLANATLMAAIVQSVFAATIESPMPTDEALQALTTPAEQGKATAMGTPPIAAYFEAQAGWYEQRTINVGINGRVAHTLPGEKFNFHTSQTPNSTYKDFARDLLREMGRCAGITYEGFTGDYAGVTFSSVRFATDENWRIVTYRRQNIVAPLCQAAFEAWLEEAIERGTVPLKGGIDRFLEERVGICNAEWKGSPKPVADELKAAQAQQTWQRMGLKSDAMIADDNGDTIADIYAERAREKQLRAKHGLPEPPASDAAKPQEEEPAQEPEKQREPEKV